MKFIKSLIRVILPETLSHRLANWVRSRRRKVFRSSITEHYYCGEKLRIHIGDAMAAAWYDHDWEDGFHEINVLKQSQLKNGARVFDIGAHQGVVALILSRLVGESGSVLAVEGDPWNAAQASKNQQTNRATNLRVINAVVGSADTLPSDLPLNGKGLIHEWSLDNVPFRSLDSLGSEFGAPDVVYVDVDGYELDVLAGANATLGSHADWFVEVHVGCGLETNGGRWQMVLSHFPEDAYERLIASERQPDFHPFDASSEVLNERFFLLALRRPI